MGEVGGPVVARVPDALIRVDLVHRLVAGRFEPQRVEDVELDLGPPERRRGDAALGEVALGLARDVARVTAVRLTAPGLDNVACHDQRRDIERRVDIGGRRIRHQQHVRLVDVLEAADARAIEADAVDEQVLAEVLDRDAEVLGLPRQVDEAQVDDQHAGLTGEQAYQRYVDEMVPFVVSKGGRVIWSGRVDSQVIGEGAEGFHVAALMEYPSRKAFLAMIALPDYQAAAVHRTAALEDSRLIATHVRAGAPGQDRDSRRDTARKG